MNRRCLEYVYLHNAVEVLTSSCCSPDMTSVLVVCLNSYFIIPVLSFSTAVMTLLYGLCSICAISIVGTVVCSEVSDQR
jgi:hypothetical protein